MRAFSEEFGQDERSLVKLPFTVLGRSDKRKISKEIRSEWEGRDENNQRKKFWKSVTASGKHGLPEYPAEELYIALLYFSTHAGFKERTIKVVPYEVLKLMRWGTDGRAYRRLRRSLSQLAGVLIETNALFDTGTQSFIEAGFHIVDNYEFKKKTKGERGGRKDVLEITWNKRLFEHFKLGRFKHLNVSFFYSLSSPLSKRLYRWLDESIYPSGRIEIDVRHLAHTRLEMSRTVWYVSSIMQRLRPALNELQDTGVCNWSLVASKTTDSKRKLVFTKPDSTDRKPVVREAKRRKPSATLIPLTKKESSFNLDEELRKMSVEEVSDIEKEAVMMLDDFNRTRFREEGRGAMSTWIMVRNNMAALLDKRLKSQ